MIPGTMPVIAGGASGLRFEYTEGRAPTSIQSSSITFAAINLGAPAADRHIVVALGSDVGVVSSVTVAGQSASRIADGNASAANTCIWLVKVPTGSFGDVAVSGMSSRCGIAVYAVYGADDLAVTANTSGSGVTPNLSLAVTKGGCVFAVGLWSNGSNRPVRLTAAAKLFPDATGATETISVTFANDDATWSGLDEDYLGNTGLTVSSARRGACAVSLEPASI